MATSRYGGGPLPDVPADAEIGGASDPAPDLRRAMTNLASGVSVLTTRDVVGRDCGLTITSLVSVSLAPPLCLVTVKRGGFMHDALEVAEGWSVTLLSTTQVALARYAARHRYPGDTDDFSGHPHRRGQASGALYFTSGVAAIECVPGQIVAAGDHSIVVGGVAHLPDDCTGEYPLIYHERGYREPGPVIAER